MLVFRVELDNGLGPYQDTAHFPDMWSMCSDHSDDAHRSPFGCPKLKSIKSYEKCGCDSPESLIKWFGDWLVPLGEHNFAVTIYRGRARVGTNGQVCFDAAAATKVDRLDMETFVDLFTDQEDF